MSYRIFALLTICVLLTGIPSFARGNDDTGLSDKSAIKNDKGNKVQTLNKEKSQNGDNNGTNTQTKDQTRTRDMLKLQIETCSNLSEEIKNQSKVSTKDQLKTQDQIRERIRTMLKTDADVENLLTDGEKDQVKSQIKEMNSIRTNLEGQIKLMEQNKDAGKNAAMFKNMEKEIKKYENNYRVMLWTLDN